MSDRYPIKSLVVGCEPDARNEPALRAALDVASRFGSRLRLVHAVDLPSPEWIAGDPVGVASRNAEIIEGTWVALAKRIQPILSEVGFEGPPLEEILSVTPGPAGRVLIDVAKSEDADIVFLGPHERRGFLDFGSTARAVLAHAPDGVWVQSGPLRPLRRILTPVDLSEQSMRALEVARALAAQFSAALTVVHGFEPPDFAYASDVSGYPVAGPTYVVDEVRESSRRAFEEAMQRFDWGGVQHETRFAEGKPVSMIQGELESGSYDLVVMGSHGRTGLSSVVLGNVAYSVLKESKIPVLALRHPGREWLV